MTVPCTRLPTPAIFAFFLRLLLFAAASNDDVNDDDVDACDKDKDVVTPPPKSGRIFVLLLRARVPPRVNTTYSTPREKKKDLSRLEFKED